MKKNKTEYKLSNKYENKVKERLLSKIWVKQNL